MKLIPGLLILTTTGRPAWFTWERGFDCGCLRIGRFMLVVHLPAKGAPPRPPFGSDLW
jgi:hypothetical protein